MQTSAGFKPPTRRSARFDEATSKLKLLEKGVIKVFPPGRAYCWLRTERTGGWVGCRPTYLDNPWRIRAEEWWTRKGARDRNAPERMSLYLKRAWAVYRWLHTFADPVRDRIRLLHESQMWGGLTILSRCPELVPVYDQNPQWALLVYHHLASQAGAQHLTRRLGSVFRRPKKDFLAGIGVDCPQSFTDMLGRLGVDGLKPVHLDMLLQMAVGNSPYLKRFRHAPIIPPPLIALAFASDTRSKGEGFWASPRLVNQLLRLAASPHPEEEPGGLSRDDWPSYGRDVRLMKAQLQEADIPVIHSLRSLKKYHDELALRLRKFRERSWREAVLAAPPFAWEDIPTFNGMITLRHLSTGKEVMEHAVLQRNCLASRIESAVEGRSFLFEVDPDFACVHTAEVIRDAFGRFQLRECRREGNHYPHPSVEEGLTRWLRHANKSLAEDVCEDEDPPF